MQIRTVIVSSRFRSRPNDGKRRHHEFPMPFQRWRMGGDNSTGLQPVTNALYSPVLVINANEPRREGGDGIH